MLFLLVYPDLLSKSRLVCNIFYLGVLTWIFVAVLGALSFYFLWPPIFDRLIGVAGFISTVLITAAFVYWYRITKSKKIDGESFTPVDLVCASYMISILLFITVCLIWLMIVKEIEWNSRTESTLTFMMFLSFLFTLVTTGYRLIFSFGINMFSSSMNSALPGRMVRLLALSKMKALKLKQAFVRHVSHEIRSLSFRVVVFHRFT